LGPDRRLDLDLQAALKLLRAERLTPDPDHLKSENWQGSFS
jgi:hypothetical protein